MAYETVSSLHSRTWELAPPEESVGGLIVPCVPYTSYDFLVGGLPVIGKLLSAVTMALGGGRYRVALDRQPDGFVLRVSKGKSAISLSKAAIKLTPLAPFARLYSRPDGSVVLPPGLLADAKASLHRLLDGGLDVVISPHVDALQQVGVPIGFQVSYVWDPAIQSIVLQTTDEAVYIGEGWFVGGDRYWLVQGTTPVDDRWLRRSTVEGNDVIALMGSVSLDWQRRGVPYVCMARLDQSPALNVEVMQVLDGAIELNMTWRVPDAQVHDIPSLPGYVIASDALMRGVSPKLLRHSLPATSGSLRLVGQQIPRFMQHTWPAIQRFAGGCVEDLIKSHAILDGNAELILVVGSQMRDGLGVVTAMPVVSVGNARIDAAALSRQSDAGTEYIRIGTGWLPTSALTGLGIGPLGHLHDGTPLGPIKLSPSDVLNQGSERLHGPWKRIEFPELKMPQGRSPSETARLHIEFLRRWRIPGGVVSTSVEVRRAVAESMASLVSEFPTAKILVVGTNEALGDLHDIWGRHQGIRLEGTKKDPEVPAGYRGLVVASPRALEAAPALLRMQWTIVCLLEVDMLVRSTTSKLFTHLRSCRKSLVIGLFGSIDFLSRTPARDAISQIFHVNGHEAWTLFARHGLRDPAKPAPSLPRPHQSGYGAQRRPVAAAPVDVNLIGQTMPRGLSIPQRPASVPAHGPTLRPDVRRSAVVTTYQGIGYGSTANYGRFVVEARQLVTLREKPTPLVPFMCYWPTYGAMTAAQRKWYFYWRGEVRDGHYIDTDLSYIFVHVYELINNVGVASAANGYEQLWRLWMGYRERYRKLDICLTDWLADYLLANQCGPEAMKAHIEALPPGTRIRDPDLFVGYFLGSSPLQVPIALLDSLSDYRIGMSKFYRAGNHDRMDKTLPQVLQRVNAHMLNTGGVGVFDLFRPQTVETVRRDLFRSAVYASSSSSLVTATVIPYSKHLPLRTFLTALVKHTENRLRELSGYEGRLRSYSLDPLIQAAVDELLGVQSRAVAKVATTPQAGMATTIVAPPQVAIDMARVQDLERESDEVRGILLQGVEAPDVANVEIQAEVVTRRADPPEMSQLSGDLAQFKPDEDPIDALFAYLNDDERRLVNTMAKSSWQVEADILRQALPGLFLEPLIDHINELAIELLGDILIAQEEDVVLVIDDVRDDLSRKQSALTPVESWRAESTETLRTLPAEWRVFITGLVAYQREALRAIVELRDPVLVIKSIADRNGTLPELLIDSINELALETLGERIIAPGSQPPVIEEEHHRAVATIVASWPRGSDR